SLASAGRRRATARLNMSLLCALLHSNEYVNERACDVPWVPVVSKQLARWRRQAGRLPGRPPSARVSESPCSGNAMIHATVTIVVAPRQRHEVLGALRSLVSPTRVEPGCLDCRLYEDATAEGVFTVMEDWATPADFTRHLRTEAYRQMMMIMELSAVPPEVRF